MGILQNPLGINLTNHEPLIDSPYNVGSQSGVGSGPPPATFFMITETGLFMLTEDGLDLMILE